MVMSKDKTHLIDIHVFGTVGNGKEGDARMKKLSNPKVLHESEL